MTTDAVGGVWTYATGLARRLCMDGREVTLVTLGPAPRREQVETLAGDIHLACETLEEKGATHESERRMVKTGTGY
jgi:hypothetical protein